MPILGSVRAKTLVCVLGLCALLAAGCSGVQPHAAAPASLRIERLTGSVVKYGSMNPGPLWEVRLTAAVCDYAPPKDGTFPDEIRVTHFEVYKSHWEPRRTTIDHNPPYLVPLQESWRGKPCGPVQVEDPIPSEHYGVESLGNPLSCYGVALTIKAGGRRASKRAVIRCGGIGTRSCAPNAVAKAPSVVGQVEQVAVQRLRKAGFRVTIYRKPSPTVPAGIVVEQEQTSVCKGADIWLTVSTGKK
jgi:hypothetical protein